MFNLSLENFQAQRVIVSFLFTTQLDDDSQVTSVHGIVARDKKGRRRRVREREREKMDRKGLQRGKSERLGGSGIT